MAGLSAELFPGIVKLWNIVRESSPTARLKENKVWDLEVYMTVMLRKRHKYGKRERNMEEFHQ